jgi:protein SCO1/2
VIRFLFGLLLLTVIYSTPVVNNQVVAQRTAARYACPMHPEVTSRKPGKCPKCNMALTPTRAKATKPTAPEKPTTDATTISSLRIPDVKIQDQHAKSLNFYRDLVQGKVVAVNFVFTTCTAICPSLTATFRKLQQQLAERKIDAQLISISVDPATDTPERLHAFAEKFKAEPGWTFVTGNSSDIDLLLQQFGVAVANKNDHTPMVLIGNEAAGYWTRAYGLSSPATLVKLITEAAERK